MSTTAPRLKQKYLKEVIPKLQKQLGYTSPMQIPKITKVCINQGMGIAVTQPKLLEKSIQELTLIAGQKAVPTKAKKAISNFKLRIGMPIGARVTLRGNHMWDFIDRLLSLALPRSRNFQGISIKGFDKQANYNLGIKEQTIFLEVSLDKVERFTGMNITFVTNTNDLKASKQLFQALGFPFQKPTSTS